jgi:hypothetical protein
MEFSYKITEAEYLRACKLGRKSTSNAVFKTVMFWFFVLVCLVMLWAVVQKNSQPADTTDQPVVTEESTSTPEVADAPANSRAKIRSVLENVLPAIFLIGIWIFIVFRLLPMRLSRIYKKDPYMQGQFTVNILPDSITVQNTVGSFSQTVWGVYDFWREGKDIFVLKLHSGASFAMSLAALSEPQRDELRGILSTALPRK